MRVDATGLQSQEKVLRDTGGGAHARRVLSVPLRRQENAEPQARFHQHLQFIHHYGHGISLTAPRRTSGHAEKAAKLPLALEDRQYISRGGGDAKVPGLTAPMTGC